MGIQYISTYLRRDMTPSIGQYCAAGRTRVEIAAAAGLQSRVWNYDRIGHDARRMTFLADGTIGLGAAGREIVWDITCSGYNTVLEIASRDEITCHLVLDAHGIWRGEWLMAERMPVALSPTETAIFETPRVAGLDVGYCATIDDELVGRLYPYPTYSTLVGMAGEAGLVSLLDNSRLHQLTMLLMYSLPLEGATIECGVYKGGVTAIMGALAGLAGKSHYACDSFVGLPEHSSLDPVHRQGDFSDTSIEAIRSGLDRLGLGEIVSLQRGWFYETFARMDVDRFCFAHIDADYYESTVQCLNHIYPRLSPGGWIVFDDYDWHHCTGVKVAVDQFFTDSQICRLSGSAAAVQKPYV